MEDNDYGFALTSSAEGHPPSVFGVQGVSQKRGSLPFQVGRAPASLVQQCSTGGNPFSEHTSGSVAQAALPTEPIDNLVLEGPLNHLGHLNMAGGIHTNHQAQYREDNVRPRPQTATGIFNSVQHNSIAMPSYRFPTSDQSWPSYPVLSNLGSGLQALRHQCFEAASSYPNGTSAIPAPRRAGLTGAPYGGRHPGAHMAQPEDHAFAQTGSPQSFHEGTFQVVFTGDNPWALQGSDYALPSPSSHRLSPATTALGVSRSPDPTQHNTLASSNHRGTVHSIQNRFRAQNDNTHYEQDRTAPTPRQQQLGDETTTNAVIGPPPAVGLGGQYSEYSKPPQKHQTRVNRAKAACEYTRHEELLVENHIKYSRLQWNHLTTDQKQAIEQAEADYAQRIKERRDAHNRSMAPLRLFAEQKAQEWGDRIAFEDLRSEIFKLFPSLQNSIRLHSYETRFLEELQKPSSILFRRLFGAQHRETIQPGFTILQLTTLGFLAQEDRLAGTNEIRIWLVNLFPWFANKKHRSYFEPDGSEVYNDDLAFIDNLFLDIAKRYDKIFEPVDPTSGNHGGGLKIRNLGLAWRLLPGVENFIFEELYSKDSSHFWRHPRPYRSKQALRRGNNGPLPVLLHMPGEILIHVLRYCVKISETVHVFEPDHTTGFRLCVQAPDWATQANQASQTVRGKTPKPAALYNLPPLSELLPLVGNPFWDTTVYDVFFRENRFILEDYYHNSRGQTTFIASKWLDSIGPKMRKFVNNIEIRLNFRASQARMLGSTLRQLGESQHLTNVTMTLNLPDRYTGHVRSIPGFNILRRFRGVKHFKFVPSQPVPGMEMLERRIKRDKKNIGKDNRQIHPQALQSKPCAISTMMRCTWEQLERMAKAYDPDRDIAAERKSSPKLTKEALANWVYDKQGVDYFDSDDDIDELRSTKRRAKKGANEETCIKKRKTGTESSAPVSSSTTEQQLSDTED